MQHSYERRKARQSTVHRLIAGIRRIADFA
jgi:hypothetical protein